MFSRAVFKLKLNVLIFICGFKHVIFNCKLNLNLDLNGREVGKIKCG